MKRLWAAALALLLLGGCGAGRETVSLEGSTAMTGVVLALEEVFRAREPGIRVNFSGTGSGAGIQSALSGGCDIGLSSRELTSRELALGAKARVIALDGIAVAVHPSNPVRALTLEELKAIFTGELRTWAGAGGAEAPVAVYGREAGSGTRAAFEAAIGAPGGCRYTNEYNSTGDVVGNVASNPNAIGYISLSAAGAGVAVLDIEGVPCTMETVRDGSYPICRPFLFVTRSGAPLSRAAEAFYTFAIRAEETIALAGAAPAE